MPRKKPAEVLPFQKPKANDRSTWSPYMLKRSAVLQAMCFSPDPLMTDCMAACLTADAETLAQVHWLLCHTERSNKQ